MLPKITVLARPVLGTCTYSCRSRYSCTCSHDLMYTAVCVHTHTRVVDQNQNLVLEYCTAVPGYSPGACPVPRIAVRPFRCPLRLPQYLVLVHQSTGSMPTMCGRFLLNHAPARVACTASMLSKNRPHSGINSVSTRVSKFNRFRLRLLYL